MRRILDLFALFRERFSVFKKHPPIASAEEFGEFLATRAAYIAQRTLYGYLKTRMGIAYPNMFQDDVFVKSMNFAKWNIYEACLSDLAIFMAAKIFVEEPDKSKPRELALYWYGRVIKDRFENSDFTGNTKDFLDGFKKRLKNVDWQAASVGEGAFQTSPPALIRWAPISDEYKKFDEPLVLNSIRFAWQAIRREYVKLLDPPALEADWAIYRRDGVGAKA